MSAAHRELIRKVIAGVRRDCDPRSLTLAHMFRNFHGARLAEVFAVGKAAAGMAQGWHQAPNRPDWVDGLIVVPRGTPTLEFKVHFAGHPLPTAESRTAGRLIGRRTLPMSGNVECISMLLSGGASSLMIDPPDEISVESYRAIVQALLLAGASIQELNVVRKHIDYVKGGWLARRYAHLPMVLVVLSDVIGDDLSTIGSGPASGDPSTFSDALDVLDKYRCSDTAPSVTRWLTAGANGEHEETPKPGDPCFARVSAAVLANNQTAVDSAAETLKSERIDVRSVRLGVTGDAASVGAALGADAGKLAAAGGQRALLLGGETTVAVGSASGKGGRNQELALAAALKIENQPGITIATFATDGVDGPTDAAGAIVTGDTCRQARQLGVNPAAALARHDSYTLFEALDKAGFPHLLRTGPTGTNVNDVAIALVS